MLNRALAGGRRRGGGSRRTGGNRVPVPRAGPTLRPHPPPHTRAPAGGCAAGQPRPGCRRRRRRLAAPLLPLHSHPPWTCQGRAPWRVLVLQSTAHEGQGGAVGRQPASSMHLPLGTRRLYPALLHSALPLIATQHAGPGSSSRGRPGGRLRPRRRPRQPRLPFRVSEHLAIQGAALGRPWTAQLGRASGGGCCAAAAAAAGAARSGPPAPLPCLSPRF